MKSIHRRIIKKWLWLFVKLCDIDLLLKALERKEVFSKEEILKYSNTLKDPFTRKRVFNDIQFQGPHAFTKLVAALRETNQNGLADLLESLQFTVKPASRLFDNDATALPTYSTHSKNRGHVLIINIINYANHVFEKRSDAEIDGSRLQELFEQMGLEVEMHLDLTGIEMAKAILKFRSNLKLKNTDMVFVIIMGHGYYANELISVSGSDNANITTNWVETQFDNGHCALLQKKPKIIMYQGRRTEMPDLFIDQGTEHNRMPVTNLTQSAELLIRMVPKTDLRKQENIASAQLNLPALSMQPDSGPQIALRSCTDMLIIYTTLLGDPPQRDMYPAIFCEIIMTYAHAHHLEEMLKAVGAQREIRQSTYRTGQTSKIINQGFNKHFYFHPKIYMENDELKNINDDSIINLL